VILSPAQNILNAQSSTDEMPFWIEPHPNGSSALLVPVMDEKPIYRVQMAAFTDEHGNLPNVQVFPDFTFRYEVSANDRPATKVSFKAKLSRKDNEWNLVLESIT